jgi:glycerol-3-phosphate dehydrogenase
MPNLKRNNVMLSQQEFDLLIIGGGIHGLACARDAAFRGFNVALIEKNDFGSQTSSNSAKIAHCGMRYLQHLDFTRMRESIKERNALHQHAPYLVESIPFLMPIYGHGIKGKETMTIYLKIYDWLSPERHQFDDSYRRVPNSSIISKEEVLKIAPYMNSKGLTGGALWYEGQMQNTERLSFSVLKSAAEKGAKFANYTKLIRLHNEGNRIIGAEVKDLLSGDHIHVRARYVLNAAGPWTNKIFELSNLNFKDHKIYASKAFSLITKSLSKKYAITFPIRPMYKDKSSVVDKSSSLQFAIPWRGKTMFASLHLACDENPKNVTITEEEIKTYIHRINEGFPTANLIYEDVEHVLWGIIPAENKGEAAPLKHHKIIDHEKEDNILGFGTVVGVKYTTARDVAEKTIDMVAKKLQPSPTPSKTMETALWGGDLEYFEKFVESIIEKYSTTLPENVIRNLIKTYGSKCEEVISYIHKSPKLSKILPNSCIIAAQIVYSAREELAETLSDIILRRTDLGSMGYPSEETIQACLDIMAAEKGWDEEKKLQEIDALRKNYLVLPELSYA